MLGISDGTVAARAAAGLEDSAGDRARRDLPHPGPRHPGPHVQSSPVLRSPPTGALWPSAADPLSRRAALGRIPEATYTYVVTWVSFSPESPYPSRDAG